MRSHSPWTISQLLKFAIFNYYFIITSNDRKIRLPNYIHRHFKIYSYQPQYYMEQQNLLDKDLSSLGTAPLSGVEHSHWGLSAVPYEEGSHKGSHKNISMGQTTHIIFKVNDYITIYLRTFYLSCGLWIPLKVVSWQKFGNLKHDDRNSLPLPRRCSLTSSILGWNLWQLRFYIKLDQFICFGEIKIFILVRLNYLII